MTTRSITQIRVVPADGAQRRPWLALVSASGLVGVGELWPGDTEDILEAVEAVSPILLGADPLNRETLWQSLRSSTRDWEDTAEVICGTVAGCDCALWDLGAKALGVPGWVLAGGRCRPGVEVCAECGDAQDPQALEAAARLVAAGVRTIAMAVPVSGEDRSIPLRRVRRRAGAEVLLIARAAEAAESVEQAVALGCELDRAEPYLVEGLLADGAWNELAQVRDRIASATSAGRSTLGLHKLWRPVEVGCADVLTVRLDGAEGPSGALKLADLTGLRGIRLAVEASGVPSALAAAHVCAARTGAVAVRMSVDTCDALQAAGLMTDGRLVPPEVAGLGVPDAENLQSEPLGVFDTPG